MRQAGQEHWRQGHPGPDDERCAETWAHSISELTDVARGETRLSEVIPTWIDWTERALPGFGGQPDSWDNALLRNGDVICATF